MTTSLPGIPSYPVHLLSHDCGRQRPVQWGGGGGGEEGRGLPVNPNRAALRILVVPSDCTFLITAAYELLNIPDSGDGLTINVVLSVDTEDAILLPR